MSKTMTIMLDVLKVGQILEGLDARADSWQKTAECLASGYFSDEPFICEACSSAGEAARIAEYYREIIRDIEHQVSSQEHRTSET